MKKSLYVFAVGFLFFASANADIYPASTLFPIEKELESCNEETLVLLDIGGTLLVPQDPILHTSHDHWRNEWFERHYPNLTQEEKVELIRIVEESKNCWRLADAWPDLISLAQRQGAKVVAFTKVLMDPSLQHLRVARMALFGLSFKDDFPELNGTQFVYEQGIIQTGEKLKGPVLKEVLEKMAKKPQKIVFVDDRKEQLESVNKACEEAGIPAVCFHYIAFESPPFLDEMLASEQLETLVKEHRWISSKKIMKRDERMFAVIYRGYIKSGREEEYRAAWNLVARYFIEKRGAIGSCLHLAEDGLWIAYSRWPDRKTREASWPGNGDIAAELPPDIQNAILTLKDCLDEKRKLPDICMDVIEDFLR